MLAQIILPICGILLILGFAAILYALSGLADWINDYAEEAESTEDEDL